MKLHFFTHAFISLLSFAFIPLAALIDRTLTFLVTSFDYLMPMAAMPAGHVPMAPTREVTYLTQGVHRLAQNALRLGPNDDDEDDDEDGDDDIDNGLTDSRPRC